MIGLIRFTESATYLIRDSIWSSYNFRKFKYSREEQQLIKYIYPLSFNCIIIFKFNFITLIFFFFIFFHIIISSIFFVGPHAVLSNSGSHQIIYVFHGFGIPNLDWLINFMEIVIFIIFSLSSSIFTYYYQLIMFFLVFIATIIFTIN
jgi:hypothetical protein